MLGGYWVPSREDVVTATYNTVLAYSMEKGYNIVVDNMNLNPKTCAELEKMVKDFNENYTYDWKYEIEYKDFFIPVEECIRRDAMRPNPIGEKKIYEDNIKGKYNVQFVLEDNYKCVKMWREQGLVCLQPNEGKF